MPGQREDLVGLFDHVWDRFWRRMDGLDDDEWRWAPTADPRISLRWRLGHIRRLLSEDRNGAWLGRATAPQNLDDERVGGINQAYAWSKNFSDKFSGVVKQWKRRHPKAYRVMRPVLAVVVLTLLGYWLFG